MSWKPPLFRKKMGKDLYMCYYPYYISGTKICYTTLFRGKDPYNMVPAFNVVETEYCYVRRYSYTIHQELNT